jgi:hypothetical protein
VTSELDPGPVGACGEVQSVRDAQGQGGSEIRESEGGLALDDQFQFGADGGRLALPGLEPSGDPLDRRHPGRIGRMEPGYEGEDEAEDAAKDAHE